MLNLKNTAECNEKWSVLKRFYLKRISKLRGWKRWNFL